MFFLIIHSIISFSLLTYTSMSFYCNTLKNIINRLINSLRSTVSSPLMSSRLNRSCMSSSDGASPPTKLTSVLITCGNSPLVKWWFLSWSNSLNIFYIKSGISFSVNLRWCEVRLSIIFLLFDYKYFILTVDPINFVISV